MEPLAILGLAAVLFVKEAGVPIPVPGDLLVLGAGVAAAAAGPGALAVLVAILVAGYVGGTLQFLLVRSTLRRAMVRILVRFGVSQERLDALADLLRRRGATGVAVARATPGVRVGAIAASGLAALPASSFVPGLVAGNTLFVGGHFALGFVVGAPALALVSSAGVVSLVVIGLVALAVIGAVGWALIRRRRRAGEPSSPLTAWADAACPACLAIGLLPPDRIGSLPD